MPGFLWAQCDHPEWQQLIIIDGASQMIEPRDPPSCVISLSRSVSRQTESSRTSSFVEVLLPLKPSFAKSSPIRPRWSISARADRSPSRYRSPSPPSERSSYLTRSIPQLKSERLKSPSSIVRQLEKAESVSNSVLQRIETLKRKTAAVINVL